jgi:hypothetical protein
MKLRISRISLRGLRLNRIILLLDSHVVNAVSSDDGTVWGGCFLCILLSRVLGVMGWNGRRVGKLVGDAIQNIDRRRRQRLVLRVHDLHLPPAGGHFGE